MKRSFYFTFGVNHKDKRGNSLENYFTVVEAENAEEARAIMFREYGKQWAFMYDNPNKAGVEKYSMEFIDFKKLIGKEERSEVTSFLF